MAIYFLVIQANSFSSGEKFISWIGCFDFSPCYLFLLRKNKLNVLT
jgi:hypothetical protein